MTAPIVPAPTGRTCGTCDAPAEWVTRGGLRCESHVHPAHLRIARANALVKA